MQISLRPALTWPWSDFLFSIAATGLQTPTFLFSWSLNHTGIHLICTAGLCGKKQDIKLCVGLEKERDHACVYSPWNCMLFCVLLLLKVCARTEVVLCGTTNGGLAPATEKKPLKTWSTEPCPLRTGGNTAAEAVLVVEGGSHQWLACPLTRCGDNNLCFFPIYQCGWKSLLKILGIIF